MVNLKFGFLAVWTQNVLFHVLNKEKIGNTKYTDNEGVQGTSNPPLWDTGYLNFQMKKKKNVSSLRKMSSR
jgi:hypothetical protein